jgi:hypothetical protein
MLFYPKIELLLVQYLLENSMNCFLIYMREMEWDSRTHGKKKYPQGKEI